MLCAVQQAIEFTGKSYLGGYEKISRSSDRNKYAYICIELITKLEN